MKMLSRGTVVLGAWPLITACGGITRSELQQNGIKTENRILVSPQFVEILYYASLAPSGHNTQPWSVRVLAPDNFIIGSNTDRWLHGVDPGNREILLSIGAFLENLITAAGNYGYDVEYKVISEKPIDQDILDVKLKRKIPLNFPMELLKERRTVRKGHLTRELASSDMMALSSFFGERLSYFSFSSPGGRYLREGVIEANRIQAFRDEAQLELANWIRWSDSEARRHRNGLTPESMELNGITGWYARHFMNRNSVMRKDFRERTVEIAREQTTNCGGWLVVTSSDSSVPSLIETGRSFEKMLFEARRRMIAIHPMSQMLEEDPFKHQVAAALKISGPVQFILRASYIDKYPAPVSLRMPVAWFTKNVY